MKKISTPQAFSNEMLKEQKLTIGLDLGDRWSFCCVGSPDVGVAEPTLPLAQQSRYNQGLSKIATYELRSMMEHDLRHTISLLTRTPAALNALPRDLPETWTFRNEGENTSSAVDVLGHVIHGERTDWMARAKL